MISDFLLHRIRSCHDRLSRWSEHLSSDQQSILDEPTSLTEFARRSYIDSYWRVCETSPLILAAIGTFNARGDFTNAQFWAEHFSEELGHEDIQRKDISNLYGSEREAQLILARYPISPPSAALVGYFHYQVKQGNPHLLMLYRFFLELFTVEDAENGEFFERLLGWEATHTIRVHQEADVEHVKPCCGYIDQNFSPEETDAALWTIEFICDRLIESQIWILDSFPKEQSGTPSVSPTVALTIGGTQKWKRAEQ